VQDYVPVGIFILPPIIVRQVQKIEGLDEPVSAEVELHLGEAITPFADERIFSANKRGFLEFDRPSGEWKAIAYDGIIPP
jgi:hypothetical protein